MAGFRSEAIEASLLAIESSLSAFREDPIDEGSSHQRGHAYF